MARYFAQAERIYERRRKGQDFNLTRYRCGTYQFQFATDEDFQLMADALAEARRRVKGDANLTRLDWTSRCFEFGRLYWNAYTAQKDFEALAKKDGKAEAVSSAMLAQASAFSKAVEAIPVYQAEKIATVPKGGYCNPGLIHEYWLGEGFLWRQQHSVIAAGLSDLTAARLKTQTAPQVAAYWRQVGQQHPELKVFTDHQQWALLHKDAPLRNLLTNGSFEQSAAPDDPEQQKLLERFQKTDIRYADFNDYKLPELACRDWATYHRNSISLTASRDDTVAKGGRHSLLVSGAAFYGGVLHHFEPPNSRARYRLSFWYRTSGTFGAALCGVAFYKGWGFEFVVRSLGASADWKKAETEFTVNGTPEESATTIALFIQGSKPDGKAWFDDVRVEMLSPDGLAQR
jgi:hypothetical protein